MKRYAATLRAVGNALYGPSWRKPMWDALGVSERTMRRWLAGEFDIPDGVWGDLHALCLCRIVELTAWQEKLR